MPKQFYSLLFLTIAIGCCGNPVAEDHFAGESNEKALQQEFADVIPDHLPDSSKATIIAGILKDVDTDTLLVKKTCYDTSGVMTIAFYRADSLVKLLSGTGINPAGLDLGQHNYCAYYFYMDELIAYRSVCSNNRHTGRCNPVSAVSLFYFYEGHIFDEEHDIRIGNYGSCGCWDLSYYKAEGLTPEYEKKVTDELERLKDLAASCE